MLTHILVKKHKGKDRMTLGEFVLLQKAGEDRWGDKHDKIEDKIRALEEGFEWLVDVLYKKGVVTVEQVVETAWQKPDYEIEKDE